MFQGATAFNQPLSTFNTAWVRDVSAYLCWVQLDRTPNSDSIFLPNLTCYQMGNMFYDATAFNQPLSTFNTAWVTDVSAYLWRVPTWWETGFWVSINILVCRCPTCSGVPRPSINHCRHSIPPRLKMWVYIVPSPTWWESGLWFPTHTIPNFVIRWVPCSWVQRPSISPCQHSIRLRSRMWVYLCAESQLDEKPDSDLYFYPTCHQMWSMFYGASAFNQSLSTFNTAKVTSVSAYLCRVPTLWGTGFWSLIPTQSLSDEIYVLRCDGLQSGPV